MTFSLIPLDPERLTALVLDPVITLAPLCDNVAAVEEITGAVAEATLGFYDAIEARAPWFSYLARRNSDRAIVGTCSFKGVPHQRIVEIAYFTFPAYEGRGCATSMAAGLLHVARRTDDVDYVIAHTLAEENGSTTVLRRNGFEHLGTVIDPEDGDVWRWVLDLKEGVAA